LGWCGGIFASSYLALAIGRVPGLALDRAGVALVGAALMVASGAISLDDAYKAVDLDTLILLLGVMIVVAHLRLSGFFSMAGGWLMRRAHHPLVLLGTITALAGLLSAFLINDAICLALTPLVIAVVRSMRRNPMPYLLAVAMASNVGSTATITGNPQNIMIASLSHIPYTDFAITLSPVALVGLLLIVIVIALVHRGELQVSVGFSAEPQRPRTHRVLMLRALFGVLILGALLFAGQPPAKAAIIVGGLLLLTRRLKSERVYAEID
jgi:Na+/H+ antiporter NhaD/arsenite permease-like protein